MRVRRVFVETPLCLCPCSDHARIVQGYIIQHSPCLTGSHAETLSLFLYRIAVLFRFSFSRPQISSVHVQALAVAALSCSINLIDLIFFTFVMFKQVYTRRHRARDVRRAQERAAVRAASSQGAPSSSG